LETSSRPQLTINSDGKIPTGLIVTGPNVTSQELLFSQLASRAEDEADVIVVNFRSGDATSIKTVLKKLIRDGTNEEHEDEDMPSYGGGRGHRLLNYDLQLLYLHLKKQRTPKRVVVAFQDSEAFDSVLRSELIGLFQ